MNDEFELTHERAMVDVVFGAEGLTEKQRDMIARYARQRMNAALQAYKIQRMEEEQR